VTHVTTLHLGFDEGRKRAWLFEKDLVEAETQTEDGFDLTLRWSARQEAQFKDL
jgi:GTP-binding protein HflX